MGNLPKITVEQEEVLEVFKKVFDTDSYSIEDFSLLINGMYEVEKDIEVDDIVVDIDKPKSLRKVVGAYWSQEEGHKVNMLSVKGLEYKFEINCFHEHFRKATEEEIRWWNLGRDVDEYKLGDIIKNDQGVYSEVSRLFESYLKTNTHVNGIAHSLITLVTPVEQRVDKRVI